MTTYTLTLPEQLEPDDDFALRRALVAAVEKATGLDAEVRRPLPSGDLADDDVHTLRLVLDAYLSLHAAVRELPGTLPLHPDTEQGLRELRERLRGTS